MCLRFSWQWLCRGCCAGKLQTSADAPLRFLLAGSELWGGIFFFPYSLLAAGKSVRNLPEVGQPLDFFVWVLCSLLWAGLKHSGSATQGSIKNQFGSHCPTLSSPACAFRNFGICCPSDCKGKSWTRYDFLLEGRLTTHPARESVAPKGGNKGKKDDAFPDPAGAEIAQREDKILVRRLGQN